jgi:hypothetical protein
MNERRKFCDALSMYVLYFKKKDFIRRKGLL